MNDIRGVVKMDIRDNVVNACVVRICASCLARAIIVNTRKTAYGERSTETDADQNGIPLS